MKLRHLCAGFLCAVFLAVAPAASADNVRADWNHHINFSQFHTYSWGRVKVSDPFDADRIKSAINHELQQKGWHEQASGGQVTISVTDRVHDEQQAETYYSGLGGGWGMGWGWGGWGWGPSGLGGFGESQATVHNNIPVDHMVIDMFDSQSKKLIWRGISQGEVNNNPDKERQMIYHDINRLFYSFPPKSNQG